MSSLNADNDRTAWVVQDVCTRAYCTRIWRLSRREGSLCHFCSHLPLASLDSLPLCALAWATAGTVLPVAPGPPVEIGVLLLKISWALHDERERRPRDGEEGSEDRSGDER